MAEEFLFRLGQQGRGQEIGNKAASLEQLRRLGMRVPAAMVLTGAAYRRYLRGDPGFRPALEAEIARKLDSSTSYAVRSSANLEDSQDHSFAGQFTTVLNVQGRSALAQAVWSIWDTTTTPAVQEYMKRRSIPSEQLCMAVIVQEMVTPVVSGVAFSRNPITGGREIVIEAVEGDGTRLVQEGVTPLRWTFRAGKAATQPQASAIPAAVIEEVAHATARLARRVKKALDLEWVYDGQAVSWVQMRAITSLRGMPVYSNRLAREMLGGLTKPLIWSINIPMVNGAWIRMLSEVIGPNTLTPHTLAKSFHYRTYFNMGLLGEVFESLGIPAESLEMMWGITPGEGKPKFRPQPRLLRVLPRGVRFLHDKWTLDSRLPRKLAELDGAYRAFDLNTLPGSTPQALASQIERLIALTGEAAYYNILVPISMHLYNAILRGQFKKLGIDPARVDMQQNDPAFQQFNPTCRLAALHQAYQALEPDAQSALRELPVGQVLQMERLDGFRRDLLDLFERFGHLSDHGNDFSSVPWRENRETILKMIVNYLPRSEEGAHGKIRLEDALRTAQGRLVLVRRPMLRMLYQRARRFLLYREQISYIYSYGYGLFRPHFLALGEWMARMGWLEQPDDIFYLDWSTIQAVVRQGQPEADLRAVAAGHRQAMDRARSAKLPEIIYGEQPPPVESHVSRRLTGTPTSRGYCTGPARVVCGIEDFEKVQAGDILVIPYSDVGWTPLFARAAGVIAEAGGMLSHSSIIAREYGIPAVVSVPGAMQLFDGVPVSIDGYKGEIMVHDQQEAQIVSS